MKAELVHMHINSSNQTVFFQCFGKRFTKWANCHHSFKASCVQVTDPYLNLFRGLVPPLLGTIDFTPLFGFLILQFLAGTLDLGAEDDW